ncbi:MAG: phage DNA encapsidation protein, partial [Clostridia bacterium]|nr:phage DNA encapsidation protein [Clostridia bacterium]
MILSDRSDGKTTNLQTMGIEGFDADGKARVFSRRFSTEITNEFFDEVIKNVNNKNPALLEGRDYDFVKASKKHCAAMLLQPRDSDKKAKCFSFIPITQAGRLKSSLGYETHKDIFFDEYIPLDDRYTKNEVTSILEMYKTIDREHYTNRIIICGNKITQANPVFEFFNITEFEFKEQNIGYLI